MFNPEELVNDTIKDEIIIEDKKKEQSLSDEAFFDDFFSDD